MCTCGKFNPSRRALLAGAAAMAAFGRLRPAQAMQSGSGTLQQGSSGVLINGKPASAGAAVASGDNVATGSDGQAIFTLGDDAFLLRSGGEVSVTDGGNGREINLENGRVLSVFGPKRITLKTPHANVGIRGTAVYLESHPASTNVCVCYGRAVMIPTGDPAKAEEVETRHHDSPRQIFPAGRLPVMEPYMVTNHTDEELVMLEALLGRVPPFVR